MSMPCFWKEFHATILRDGFLDLISRTQMPARRLTRMYSLGMCSGRFFFDDSSGAGERRLDVVDFRSVKCDLSTGWSRIVKAFPTVVFSLEESFVQTTSAGGAQ